MRPTALLLAAGSLFFAAAALASDQHDPAILVPMDRDAMRFSLSASGGRVVLVNLWATRCTSCLVCWRNRTCWRWRRSRQRPIFGYRLLAISMDDAYSERWVIEFKAKHFPTLVSVVNS